MPLIPEIAALFAARPQAEPARTKTAAQHRAQLASDMLAFPAPPPPEVFSSVALSIEGVPCRLHRPGPDPSPVLVFCHGGGWIFGGLDMHEALVRRICAEAGISVLAVDYRLAPEHAFPAALEDCLSAARWAGEQGFTAVAVGGDSAGGNLAASVALVFRAEGRPLAAQLLIYPCLDAGASSPSYAENGVGLGLDADDMRWLWEQYAGTHPRDDPLLSPCAATDLAGLPAAVVVSAGCDVLRDEADHYAARLAEAGVPVRHLAYGGMPHGFLSLAASVPAAEQATVEVLAALRSTLGVSPA